MNQRACACVCVFTIALTTQVDRQQHTEEDQITNYNFHLRSRRQCTCIQLLLHQQPAKTIGKASKWYNTYGRFRLGRRLTTLASRVGARILLFAPFSKHRDTTHQPIQPGHASASTAGPTLALRSWPSSLASSSRRSSAATDPSPSCVSSCT